MSHHQNDGEKHFNRDVRSNETACAVVLWACLLTHRLWPMLRQENIPSTHPPKNACLNAVKCQGGACNTAQQQKGEVLPAHRISEAQDLEKQDLKLMLHSHSSLIAIELSVRAELLWRGGRRNAVPLAAQTIYLMQGTTATCRTSRNCPSKTKFLLCFKILSTLAV